MNRLILAAVIALVAMPASAQKPHEASALELGADPAAAVSADGLTALRSGRPAMLANVDRAVSPGTPEQMAREYLATQTTALGLKRADTADLAFSSDRVDAAGTTVRFQQTVGGVPVWGPLTIVNLDPQNRVQLVFNTYDPSLAVASTTPAISADAARATVGRHLGTDASGSDASLVIWPADSGARLAYEVHVSSDAVLGAWEAIVDAQTGDLLRVADRAVYEHVPGETRTARAASATSAVPVAEPRALPMAPLASSAFADGTGYVFLPDPLSAAQVDYGAPGYTDGGDADTPQLTAIRSLVTLRDLTFDGTNYNVRGPWAEAREYEPPTKGLFPQPSPDFTFTRNQDGFEVVNTYYHIDTYMRYINETLGIALRPYQYATGGVRYDAHGFNGADNSNYRDDLGRLSFGEGGVDDNEDADVIIHELGHGLHDWLTRNLSQVQGLSEGLGDYFAVSYSRSFNQWPVSALQYTQVFTWDGGIRGNGSTGTWGGRRVNSTLHYPEGLSPPPPSTQNDIYYDSALWSTTLLQIWNDIGRVKTDRAVMAGIGMTNGSTNQQQAAQAVLTAAVNLGYSAADVEAFRTRFAARGYSVTVPVASEGGPRAGASAAELTAAAPNPFTGTATFELLLAEPQHVTVEVFDVLGRRVSVLFDGPLGADQRHAFAIGATGLTPGVYVYRATGERFTASRRVTLVK